jgi:hypothetical protein
MVNLCSRNEKHKILLGKDELPGVEFVIHVRTVIEFGMEDWKKVICLKTQSYSRPVCIRSFSILMLGEKISDHKNKYEPIFIRRSDRKLLNDVQGEHKVFP